MVLCGMVLLRDQMTKNQLKLGINSDNGKHWKKNQRNGNLVPIQILEVIHGQIRKNNAGVKINQHTNHGNVLKKVKNASVIMVSLSMELKLVLIRKNLISLVQSNFQWQSTALMEKELSNAMLLHLMVLIQLQTLIKHASVIKKRNTLIQVLLKPPELSGNPLKLNLNPKVS